eukprot:COSAG05_NODE_16600_length_342_cov_0.855967_2_plen_34_part_01
MCHAAHSPAISGACPAETGQDREREGLVAGAQVI